MSNLKKKSSQEGKLQGTALNNRFESTNEIAKGPML